MKRLLLAAVVFACAASASAQWSDVTYDLNAGEESRVYGPDRHYTSVRPKDGQWTFSAGLGNHPASLEDGRIEVHSASVVQFGKYNAASGNAGRSSHVTFKVRLSEPISGATWRIGTIGRNVSAGAKLAARYSTDGEHWTDAYVCPAGGSGNVPVPDQALRFDSPTTALYFGWYADVPEGQTGWWLIGSTGEFTFAPAKQNATPAAAPVAGEDIDLQGPRFIPNEFFGTTTHVNSEGTMRLLDELNIRTVSINFRWPVLEFGRGEYAWSKERDFGKGNWVIDSADLGVEHGLDQVPMIDQPPAWATGENGTYPNDESVEAFEEFCYQIATHYKGKIRYWIANNEPDMAIWKDRFIVFLKAMHSGIKRADPENKVLLAGFAGVESQQLEAVYRLGGKDYFDILTSHPYTRPLPPEAGLLERMEANYRVMKKYGDDKPIWITEMGWNGVEADTLEYCRHQWPDHRAYSCTEEEQARYLARGHLLAATMPWVERFFFFHLHQEHPYDQALPGADGYMGLFSPWIDGNVRPKEAWFAVKTVIAILNEANYVGQIDMGSRIWALMFERDNETTFAIWSLDDGVTLTVDDGSAIKTVTGMVGTPVLALDGKLPVSGRPIYVKTDRADREAFADKLRNATIEGGKVFELAVGLDMERTEAATPCIDVRLTNVGNATQKTPAVFVEVEEPWQTKTEKVADGHSLAAGEEGVYPIELSGPRTGGEVVLRAKAHFFHGERFLRDERTIRYVTAGAVPAGFKADGDLAEWADATPVAIGEVQEQRDMPGWAGPDDCSGRWYAAWDQDNLYFAAAIRDNVHVQKTDTVHAGDIWRSDSIQLAIDAAGDAKPSSNVPQYDNVNDYELGFALGAEGPLDWIWVNPGDQPGQANFKQLAVVRDETAKVTYYEAAIPWSILKLPGSPEGRWIGFNVLVNDDDGESRRGWINWAPGIGNWKDPSLFPKMRMVK